MGCAASALSIQFMGDDAKAMALQDGGQTGAILIGRIPLMLRSDRCVLRGRGEEALARFGAPLLHADCCSSCHVAHREMLFWMPSCLPQLPV